MLKVRSELPVATTTLLKVALCPTTGVRVPSV